VWGGREVIAEERDWRADLQRSNWSRRRWAALRAPGWPGWLDDQRPSVLDPGQIARLYRALRRAARTARTSRAPPTSTTARWRCAAAPAPAAIPMVSPARSVMPTNRDRRQNGGSGCAYAPPAGHVSYPQAAAGQYVSPRARLAAARPDRRVHVLIVTAGKCVAACRRSVLRWPRRGKVHPLYQEGGARDVR
jgi:hypothetical protein